MAHKAGQLGYHPQVILSGRRVNDMMPEFIAGKVVKLMIQKGIQVKDANALILGITFKENCPDIRNTKVVNIYSELKQYGINVDVYDPWADKEEVKSEYNIETLENIIKDKKYEVVVLAVSHNEFKLLNIASLKADSSILFDVKAFLDRDLADARL